MDHRPISYSALMYDIRFSVSCRDDPPQRDWPDQSPYYGSDSLNCIFITVSLISSYSFL